jgi:hypothetical protein
MKKSAEIYLTQDGKTYRLYADVEEQLSSRTVDGKITPYILYVFYPIFANGVESLKVDLKKPFEEVIILYNTHIIELINCTIFRKNSIFFHTYEVVHTRVNSVGMWHTLDWEI